MIKRILLGIGVLLALLVLVLVIKTSMFRSKQIQAKPVKIEVDTKALAGRLSRSVQFATISHQDHTKVDAKAFLGLHQYLQQAFPKVHATLQREVVNQYSLLYTWKGSDPKLKPYLLMGHMDVVPVQSGTEKEWKHPAFSGKIADGFVWGRGSMDDKVAVLGGLEAVEWLLQKGYKPKRTVYLAFGHDEEVGGEQGAKKIAALLHSRKVELDYVLDEALVIIRGVMPGLTPPLALIGIAEKGYLTVKLTARAEGGHSSMPPKNTAAGILSRAIVRLESHPMPSRIEGVTGKLFAHVGPEMGFVNRMVMANLWLLGGVLKGILSKKHSTNATIRTTTAVTVLRGGVKENVLPISASALVNFRILPGDSIASVLAHVRKVIADSRVKVEAHQKLFNKEPSPISSPDSSSFRTIHQTIREIFPEVVVAPGLVIGGTDSRHFIRLTKRIYRFLPMILESKDLSRIHGTNERLSVNNYASIVRFFVQLMRNSDR